MLNFLLPFSIATTLLGTGLQMAGQQRAGAAAASMANYQAAVARSNSVYAMQLAEDARARGQVGADLSVMRTKQAIGAQRASAAARGLEVDQDTPHDIVSSTATLGAFERDMALRDAEMEALSFERQAGEFLSEAELRRRTGKQAKTEAAFATGATLLSGAGSVADRWYQFANL